MRKLIYKFANQNYVPVVEKFCLEESITPFEFDKWDRKERGVLLITDDEFENLETYNLPCCLISDTKRIPRQYAVNKNFTVATLRTLMDSIVHGSYLWNCTSSLKCINAYNEYELGNNIYDVEKTVYIVTSMLLWQIPFSEVEKIRVGLSEMLTNAIEHGNLAVTHDEKHNYTESGNFQALLDERAKDLRYANRKVFFSIKIDPGQIKIHIKDEGNGFDVNSITSPVSPEHLLKLHGRGILISKAYFSKVEYNDKGNEVTLFKVFEK